ncbi:MAG: urea carboxylase, partial [Gammaproteobacteria bacterium]|nr:urea carboxylase [Gammaproteobacteria bacterium]
MFRKVLIANRGEIAVRICRTLDAMGVASAAVYAHADRGALHVEAAGEAHALGDGGVAETYVDIGKLCEAVDRSGADAVHPGYGFLSENAAFARALAERGVAFVGPRPEHLARFGLKHEARRLATAAGVALLPGSGVLADLDDALREAAAIGYPVMLKSSAGGGGIGMQRCEDAEQLGERFAAVERLAGNAFGDTRLFVERCVAAPRHVEVQAFGDGAGGVAILGDRDCSLQRRHQKVVEECPAPNLPEAVRRRMHEDARALLASVSYRSAGTVEFLYDPDREEAAFLEVNTRLQVEHGVTELVYGVDLVRWMLELAAGELPSLDTLTEDLAPSGCAIQARLCAEDPNHGFRPTPGWLSVVAFPDGKGLRTDTWLRSGTEVSPLYDSLLAKVMAHAPTREAARRRLRTALEDSVVHGVETNRAYLHQALGCDAFVGARHDTATLATLDYRPRTVEVLVPGAQTTVQAWPGRMGYWHVGVPPSGPMDDLSFRLGNRLLGNAEGAPGLEITVAGPTLAFHGPATVLVAGAVELRLERPAGAECPRTWRPFTVDRGDVLAIGNITSGMRAYLLVGGGLEVPEVMGSAATFTLGGIGGMNGRALGAGDVLRAGVAPDAEGSGIGGGVPCLDARHVLRVTMGPHCTDDFLTPADLDAFLDAEWTVHYHSSRTGVRLVGPRPEWARPDGGDAGLHPS